MSQPATNTITTTARQWVYAACGHGRSGSAGFQTWSASEGVTDEDCAELSQLSHIGAGLVGTPAGKASRCMGVVPLRSGKCAFFVVRRDGRDDLGRAGQFVSALLFDELADVPPHPLTLWSSPVLHPPLTAAQVRSPAPEHLPLVAVEHASHEIDAMVAAMDRNVAAANRRELADLLQRGLAGGPEQAMLLTGSEEEILSGMSMVWAFASAQERRWLGMISYLPEPISLRFQVSGWPYDLGRPPEQVLRRHHSIFRWRQGAAADGGLIPRELAARVWPLVERAGSLHQITQAREALGPAALGAMAAFPLLTDPATPERLAAGHLPLGSRMVAAELSLLAESRNPAFIGDCAEVIKTLCGPQFDFIRNGDERFLLDKLLPLLRVVERDTQPVLTTWVVSQRLRHLRELFVGNRAGSIEAWWERVLPYLRICEGHYELLRGQLGREEMQANPGQQLPFLLDCFTLVHTLSSEPRVPEEHAAVLRQGLDHLRTHLLGSSVIYSLAPHSPRAFLLWASVFDGANDPEVLQQFSRTFLFHWARQCRLARTPLAQVTDLEGRLLNAEVTARFLQHWFACVPQALPEAGTRKPQSMQEALAAEWAAFATDLRWHSEGHRYTEAAFHGLHDCERHLISRPAAAAAIPFLRGWVDKLVDAWSGIAAMLSGRAREDRYREAAFRSLLARVEVLAAGIFYLGRWSEDLRFQFLLALGNTAYASNSVEVTRRLTASPWPDDRLMLDLLEQEHHRVLRPWFALSQVRASQHVKKAVSDYREWFAGLDEREPVMIELRELLEGDSAKPDAGKSPSSTLLALPQRVLRNFNESPRGPLELAEASPSAPTPKPAKRGCCLWRFTVLVLVVAVACAIVWRPRAAFSLWHGLVATFRSEPQASGDLPGDPTTNPDPKPTPKPKPNPDRPEPPDRPQDPPVTVTPPVVVVPPVVTVPVPPLPPPVQPPPQQPDAPTKPDRAQLEKELGELSKHQDLQRQPQALEILRKAKVLNDELAKDGSPEGRRLHKSLQDLIQRWNGPFQAHVEVMQLRAHSGLEALDLTEAFAALVPEDPFWKRMAAQAKLDRPKVAASAQRAQAEQVMLLINQRQMSTAEALLKANPAVEQEPLLAQHLARLRAALEAARAQVEAAKAAFQARKFDATRAAITLALAQDKTNDAALSLRIDIAYWTHEWDDAAGHVKSLPEGPGKAAWTEVADKLQAALKAAEAAGHATLAANAEALKAAQTTLARLGCYAGKPDGRPGPGTTRAILLFQVQQKLPLTGQLDPATLEALGKAGGSER